MADATASTSPDPSTKSGDYTAMEPYWDMVDAELGGETTMKAAASKYLPQFPGEDATDYKFRLENAKYTNIFSDIVEMLAAKPFDEEVGIKNADAVSADLKALVEDIDGQGNHLHVFAGDTFEHGVSHAIDWIMVEFPPMPAGLTRAQEKEAKARPYWVHIRARNVLDVQTARIGGEEVFTHFRIYEPVTVTNTVTFTEEMKERVRVIDRAPFIDPNDPNQVTQYGSPVFQVYEKQRDREGREIWIALEGSKFSGVYSIGVIPVVPFITGRRRGKSWRIKPPMRAAAELQIQHYQLETGLKAALTMSCYPMLAGNGVTPPTVADGPNKGKPARIVIGPKTVLIAPPNPNGGSHGEWTFIEPSAESLRFVSGEVDKTAKELRELGRQPLTANSGNLTVVTTQFAAAKGNTAAETWALNLKDTLENAFILTQMWLQDTGTQAEVRVKSDFGQDIAQDQTLDSLISMRKSGPGGEPDISRETLWEEAQRRGKLSPDFDPEKEQQRLIDELPDGLTPEELAAAMTPPDPGGNPPPPDSQPGQPRQAV